MKIINKKIIILIFMFISFLMLGNFLSLEETKNKDLQTNSIVSLKSEGFAFSQPELNSISIDDASVSSAGFSFDANVTGGSDVIPYQISMLLCSDGINSSDPVIWTSKTMSSADGDIDFTVATLESSTTYSGIGFQLNNVGDTSSKIGDVVKDETVSSIKTKKSLLEILTIVFFSMFVSLSIVMILAVIFKIFAKVFFKERSPKQSNKQSKNKSYGSTTFGSASSSGYGGGYGGSSFGGKTSSSSFSSKSPSKPKKQKQAKSKKYGSTTFGTSNSEYNGGYGGSSFGGKQNKKSKKNKNNSW